MKILDPTAERRAVERPLAARDATSGPRVIGLIDIRKPQGDLFLDEVEAVLRARNLTVVRDAKPTFTKPAPADLRRSIAERCDAVIEALAD